MTILLTKPGDNVDLTKAAGGTLTNARIALGWDQRKSAGDKFDLDASIIGCGGNQRSAGADWFVFYNRLKSPGDAIVHQGDERTGETEGDDEQILVDFTKVPDSVTELAIAITIHDAAQRSQHFGLVDNAYVRVINEADGAELVRYNLSEDGSGYNTVVVGRAFRADGGWCFESMFDGSTTELQGLVDKYQIA